jgi:hypothetical protein
VQGLRNSLAGRSLTVAAQNAGTSAVSGGCSRGVAARRQPSAQFCFFGLGAQDSAALSGTHVNLQVLGERMDIGAGRTQLDLTDQLKIRGDPDVPVVDRRTPGFRSVPAPVCSGVRFAPFISWGRHSDSKGAFDAPKARAGGWPSQALGSMRVVAGDVDVPETGDAVPTSAQDIGIRHRAAAYDEAWAGTGSVLLVTSGSMPAWS